MVTRYGMTERLGHVALEKDRRSFLATDQPYYGPQERGYSDETAAAIDEEVKRIVEEAFARAVGLLEEHRDVLETMSRLLLARETLHQADLQQVFGHSERASDAPLLNRYEPLTPLYEQVKPGNSSAAQVGASSAATI